MAKIDASDSSPLKQVSSSKCFEGFQKVYSHFSSECQCEMKFSIYIPHHNGNKKFPVLYFLSGLTCTEQNFIIKSGFQQYAEKHQLIVVGPDTSPRGCNIEGEEDSYDFGSGAGFYLDATEDKWKKNYRMYSYVTKELPPLIDQYFPTTGKKSISGHSMGGHGAITIALKNPEKYSSVSAFSPISNPCKGPWGKRAFTGYLGPNESTWNEYDSTLLAKDYTGPQIEILVSQGSDDPYLTDELLPSSLKEACSNSSKVKLIYQEKPEYDHSFFFISTFIGDHIEYHAKKLHEN